MATHTITPEGVTVIDDANNQLTISSDSDKYDDAVKAVLDHDYPRFSQIAFSSFDDEEDEDEQLSFNNVSDLTDVVSGLIEDGLIDAEDLGIETAPKIGEHDLSQWSGSPIYYDNREEAERQAELSHGFWKFHDFGTNTPSPLKYRYATVPTGFGPTAPEGYDWVCLKRS